MWGGHAFGAVNLLKSGVNSLIKGEIQGNSCWMLPFTVDTTPQLGQFRGDL